MKSRLKTVIINWHGPFRSLEDITPEQKGNGLYFLWGKTKGQKNHRFQYIGITEQNFTDRFKDPNHRCHELRFPESSIWLGHIHYPSRYKRNLLELGENCLCHFAAPDKNKNKLYQPRKPGCIISQWCTQEGIPRLRRPSLPDYMPEMLWWDTERWRTGNMKVWGLD
ncbi:hypothetical protein I5M27_08695 [Adhaeribacter sp. BT258]|uniref:JAB domain-containing protein n=1 Tax=Adhaeribacter terrigena TaxID=2793070 RepID=A0ABS1C0X8_9BACT|nr:hypothetical protein [Adhaeribacter terrigena]MBK0403063.1 hypothetical protein [Adhaeribacter terrigena]